MSTCWVSAAGDLHGIPRVTRCFKVTNITLRYPLCQVWRHHVGDDAGEHKLVYHETDDQMYVHLGKSRDEKILSIHVGKSPLTGLHETLRHAAVLL